MEQYNLIWKYQQVDMELEQYEKEMRNNSNRKELIRYRDFLLEQQAALKKIESDAEIMGDRLEALVDEVDRLNNQIQDMTIRCRRYKNLFLRFRDTNRKYRSCIRTLKQETDSKEKSVFVQLKPERNLTGSKQYTTRNTKLHRLNLKN